MASRMNWKTSQTTIFRAGSMRIVFFVACVVSLVVIAPLKRGDATGEYLETCDKHCTLEHGDWPSTYGCTEYE